MRLEARPPASFSSLRAANTALNDYQSGGRDCSSVITQSHGSQEIHPLVLQKRLRKVLVGPLLDVVTDRKMKFVQGYGLHAVEVLA